MKLRTAKKRWSRWRYAHSKRFQGGYSERLTERDSWCQWIWLDAAPKFYYLVAFINGNCGSLPKDYVVPEGIQRTYPGRYKRFVEWQEWMRTQEDDA